MRAFVDFICVALLAASTASCQPAEAPAEAFPVTETRADFQLIGPVRQAVLGLTLVWDEKKQTHVQKGEGVLTVLEFDRDGYLLVKQGAYEDRGSLTAISTEKYVLDARKLLREYVLSSKGGSLRVIYDYELVDGTVRITPRMVDGQATWLPLRTFLQKTGDGSREVAMSLGRSGEEPAALEQTRPRLGRELACVLLLRKRTGHTRRGVRSRTSR